MLERAGERPDEIAPGQGFTWHLEDGSEVHSGTHQAGSLRHRLGVFSQENFPTAGNIEAIRDRAVAVLSQIAIDQ
jgi:hypothetical protein